MVTLKSLPRIAGSTLALLGLLLAGLSRSLAQAPVELNGVMLQAFYWNVPQTTPNGSWWKNLQRKADEFAEAGFTGIWLPPPYKGAAGRDDVGYGVYDRYDLGEFDQEGSVATRYGTFDELKAAVAALKAKGIQVYCDVVMNHMMGADEHDQFDYAGGHFDVPTKFTFPGRGNKYSNYTWQYFNFNGYQQSDGSWLNWKGGWDFAPYHDAWDNLMGCEIRYLDPNNRDELVRWGQWLTTTLGLDGYRLDATKHMYTPFVNQWLDQVKGHDRFAVSEAVFYDMGDLQNYAGATGGRTSLFDFPLHKVFAEALNPNGPGDLRTLRFAGFTELNGPLSVSFVDNHDTDRSFAVVNQKMLAYAYLLMRDKGYPCVFYKDYYEYGLGSQIKQLLQIRRDHAHGPSWEHEESDSDVYLYSRAGDAQHRGLLLVLCDQNATPRQVRTPFANARLRDLTGNQTSEVVTDHLGNGTIPLTAHSYSTWSPVASPMKSPVASALPAPARPAQPVRPARPPISAKRATAALGSGGSDSGESDNGESDDDHFALAAEEDPLNEAVDKVVYLDQNWSASESNRFHFTPQGSQIIPYDWFLALEQADSPTPFRDNRNMLKYRYLTEQPSPLNPDGLPVGFVSDQGQGRAWLGMTCAACHTTEIHLGKTAYRVDGAPTHGDVQAFLTGMVAAMQQTQNDSTKFARFAAQVLGDNNTPHNHARLRAQLAASIKIRVGYNLRNFPGYDPTQSVPLKPASYGRLDAVDAIVNEVFHLAIADPDPANPTQEAPTQKAMPADAPVSYPFLWDTPQHDRVEWLGIAQSGGPLDIFSLGRNVGEVIGVFGDVAIPDHPSLLNLGYASSVKIEALGELEDLVKTLWSPQWPADFPPVDRDAAAKGALLYQQKCVECHALIDRSDPSRTVKAIIDPAGTDPQASLNFFTRTGSSGKLNGANVNLVPFTSEIGPVASANAMLTNVVVGTILGRLKDAPPDELNQIDFRGPRLAARALPAAASGAAYKARPLNGIWATAPYLHNGSVPNLDALLQPAAKRPSSFSIGVRTFDPVRVGYLTDVIGFPKFSVRGPDGAAIAGNSNAGHEYGSELSDDERRQLVEYLKTL
jgi:alpha-amylase